MDPQDKSSREIAQELKALKDMAYSLLDRIKDLEQRNAEPCNIEPSVSAIQQPPMEEPKAPDVPSSAELPVENVQSFESQVGRIWFNRIGMVAIIFGAAYFMKYAFDNNWIGVTGRVIIGLCVGLALILLGELGNKKKFEKFAEGLIAGGASIIYLSILAAFSFYHLIGPVPAFAFMSIVTLYTGVFSIRYNSPGVLSFGLVGGFLTLFLIGSNEVNPAFRMFYVFLLDAGVLAVSYHKKFVKSNILALVFTMIWFLIWFTFNYEHKYLAQTVGFLTLVYILFGLLSILYNFVHKQVSSKTDVSIVMLNGLFYFIAICKVLLNESVAYRNLGYVALGMAVVYLNFSYTALERTDKQDRNLILSYLGLTLLFATLTIPLLLEGSLISLGLIAEATVLVWLGFKIDYKELRNCALFIGFVAIFKMLFFDFPSDTGYLIIFNRRFLSYLALAAGSLISAYNYRQNSDKTFENEKSFATVLALLTAVILLVALTQEVNTYFDRLGTESFQNLNQFSISALWAVYSFVLILIGIFRKFRALRLMALCLFTITILKVFIFDIWNVGQLWRILSFIALGIVLVATSFFYQKYKDELINFVKG